MSKKMVYFSAKGKNFKLYVESLKQTYKLIKDKKFKRSKIELKNKIFRRSIYAIKNIKKGEKFTKKNIQTFRPDVGLSSSYFLKILGKNSPIKIEKDFPLPKGLLKNNKFF